MSDIQLLCQDVAVMLAGLPDGCAQLLHFDPPWQYGMGLPQNYSEATGVTLKGLARAHYDGLPEATIAEHIALSARVAAPAAYLAVWCTFPKLAEWLDADAPLHAAGWLYVSGACWGKVPGLGVGKHFRGDSELLLLYKKGAPMPLDGSKSNLWITEDAPPGGLWVAPRCGHSEKPQAALRALISMAVPVGGLVIDGYAGASGSLAKACRALGRNYVGAELSAERHHRALTRLSQQEMAWEAVS